jgi:hypothetical protein
MNVQAKFRCNSKMRVNDDTVTVYLNPVIGDSVENKMWSKYTPSGQIIMNINNPEASDAFVTGKDYLITFEQV